MPRNSPFRQKPAISKELEKRHAKTAMGKYRWHITTLKSILTNEKYKGDALLQKGYTVDFLQKKRKKNNGEVPFFILSKESGDFCGIIHNMKVHPVFGCWGGGE